MSSTTYFFAGERGIHKTVITEYTITKKSEGGPYGILSLQQGSAEFRIFLNDKQITRELLNAVQRLDRRLNQCQK